MREPASTICLADKYLVTRSSKPKIIKRADFLKQHESRDAFNLYLRAIDKFRLTENAAYGLEAFVAASKASIFPPEDLLSWLTESFENWGSNGGEQSLDKILKLSRVTSGATPAIKTKCLVDRDERVISEIRELVGNFGLSKENAGYLVAERMEADSEDWALSFGSIRTDILPKLKEEKDTRGCAYNVLSDQEKIECLKRYPRHAKDSRKIKRLLSQIKG